MSILTLADVRGPLCPLAVFRGAISSEEDRNAESHRPTPWRQGCISRSPDPSGIWARQQIPFERAWLTWYNACQGATWDGGGIPLLVGGHTARGTSPGRNIFTTAFRWTKGHAVGGSPIRRRSSRSQYTVKDPRRAAYLIGGDSCRALSILFASPLIAQEGAHRE